MLRAVRHRLQHLLERRILGAEIRQAARKPPVPPLRPAVVIPVWNDAAGLARLLDQVRGMGCFSQIVVVDDGSDSPVPPASDVILLRHETSLGGGVARNTGLTAVTCAHVLFFDADDLLTDEIVHLLADLGGESEFDFCMFKHADSRVVAEEGWGQPCWDEVFWQQAGLGVGTLTEAPRVVWPLLAQTANYPWNKIYRTAFLRENEICCAATQVHQDIPLHWLGFLAASRILVSDRICAWHHVRPANGSMGSGRLTNRAGAERLQVFDALAPVMRATAQASPTWKAALVTFSLGLLDWVARRIDTALQDRLQAAEREWLTQEIAPWIDEIHSVDPALAARLTNRITGGAAA